MNSEQLTIKEISKQGVKQHASFAYQNIVN